MEVPSSKMRWDDSRNNHNYRAGHRSEDSRQLIGDVKYHSSDNETNKSGHMDYNNNTSRNYKYSNANDNRSSGSSRNASDWSQTVSDDAQTPDHRRNYNQHRLGYSSEQTQFLQPGGALYHPQGSSHGSWSANGTDHQRRFEHAADRVGVSNRSYASDYRSRNTYSDVSQRDSVAQPTLRKCGEDVDERASGDANFANAHSGADSNPSYSHALDESCGLSASVVGHSEGYRQRGSKRELPNSDELPNTKSQRHHYDEFPSGNSAVSFVKK
jgi:hypothetical protein